MCFLALALTYRNKTKNTNEIDMSSFGKSIDLCLQVEKCIPIPTDAMIGKKHRYSCIDISAAALS